MQSHRGDIARRNGTVFMQSMADLVQYLGLQALVSEIINKLELDMALWHPLIF